MSRSLLLRIRLSRVAGGVGRTSTHTCSSSTVVTGEFFCFDVPTPPFIPIKLAMLHVFHVQRGPATL